MKAFFITLCALLMLWSVQATPLCIKTQNDPDELFIDCRTALAAVVATIDIAPGGTFNVPCSLLNTCMGVDTTTGVTKFNWTGGIFSDVMSLSYSGGMVDLAAITWITLDGDDGNDTLIGTGYRETLIGGFGRDSLEGAGSRDLLLGQEDLDTCRGGRGDDTIEGGDSKDHLYGGPDDDWIDGGRGHDLIWGGSGSDTVFGNLHDDRIRCGNGKDFCFGGPGFDTVEGGGMDDYVDGGDGIDTVDGGDGQDIICGGRRLDEIHSDDGFIDVVVMGTRMPLSVADHRALMNKIQDDDTQASLVSKMFPALDLGTSTFDDGFPDTLDNDALDIIFKGDNDVYEDNGAITRILPPCETGTGCDPFV